MSKIRLYTIGFTKKSAEDFFEALKKMKIKTLIDIRLNNTSQILGFSKEKHLPYFLKEICSCAYIHLPEWAPTKEILDSYKKEQITWETYEKQFGFLLSQRDIIPKASQMDLGNACLLCSEPTADKCHRRLVAEHLAYNIDGLSICHI